MIALEFPPINAILRWKELFGSFNKISLIAIAAMLIGMTIFLLASRQDHRTAPRGVRNLAESTVDFIENGVVMQTMGRDGLGWTPFLLSLFLFIYLCNVPGIIPFLQMPATARMALPAALALMVWVVYNGAGIKHQGFGGYMKSVRLFANMLAGHILLVTFALLSEALFQAKDKILIPFGILPFFMLVFLTGFEVLVAFLQAYIFVILTAVYIGGAVHPEH